MAIRLLLFHLHRVPSPEANRILLIKGSPRASKIFEFLSKALPGTFLVRRLL